MARWWRRSSTWVTIDPRRASIGRAIEDAKTGLVQKVFVLTELQEIVQVIDREANLTAFSKEKSTEPNPTATPSTSFPLKPPAWGNVAVLGVFRGAKGSVAARAA
jgi:hypothetical protein